MTLLSVVAGFGLLAVVLLSLYKPRSFLFLCLCLLPTQNLFYPVSTFFVSPADVLISVAGIGLLGRLVTGRRQTWAAIYIHRGWLLLFACYVVGFVVLGQWSRNWIRLPLGMLPSILICDLLATRSLLAKAGMMLILAAFVDVGYGVILTAQGAAPYPGRLSGLLGVNFTALLAFGGAVIGLGLWEARRRRWYLAAGLVLSAAGALTLSRGGLLAFLFALFFVLWPALRAPIRWAVFSALATGATFVVVSPTWRDRVVSHSSERVELASGETASSIDARLRLYSLAWRLVKSSPVVGVGQGRFLETTREDELLNEVTGGGGYTTHNSYMAVLVEGGLLCAAALLWTMGELLQRVWRALRRGGKQDKIVRACVGGAAIAFGVAFFADLWLYYCFWAFVGLAMAAVRVEENNAWPVEVTRVTA